MRKRDPRHIIEVVGGAEDAGWDLTKPNTLNRARLLAWQLLWAQAPDIAAEVYGERAA